MKNAKKGKPCKSIATVSLIRHEIELRRAKRTKMILTICLILALLFCVFANAAWLIHHDKHEAPYCIESSVLAQ